MKKIINRIAHYEEMKLWYESQLKLYRDENVNGKLNSNIEMLLSLIYQLKIRISCLRDLSDE